VHAIARWGANAQALFQRGNGRLESIPATSSLGIQTYVGSKSLARFCCEFLNLRRCAESAFFKLAAQMRHKRDTCFSSLDMFRTYTAQLALVTGRLAAKRLGTVDDQEESVILG
jgi:hypothetical protein